MFRYRKLAFGRFTCRWLSAMAIVGVWATSNHLFACSDLYADDWRMHGSKSSDIFEGDAELIDGSSSKTKQVKRKRFKGYGSYRSEFKALCKLFERDNQSGWLSYTARGFKTSLRECLPCRNIYVVLFSACKEHPGFRRIIPTPTADQLATRVAEEEFLQKEQKQQEEIEGTPTPTPTPTQTPTAGAPQELEPTAAAVDLIVSIAREMAEDKEYGEENFEGMWHLIQQMRRSEGKTVAERSYYDIVSTYFLAPFIARGFLNRSESIGKSDSWKQEPTPTPNVDVLFDF